MFETAIGEGELLTEIQIPASREASATNFAEVARRRGDFATVSTAVKLSLDDGAHCTSARVVLGAVGPIPVRCRAAEDVLIGRVLDDEVLAAAVDAIDPKLIELESHGASRRYREKVARTLVRRSLVSIRNRCSVMR
jgi:carbon-monoxide dehydrogenase medium subunit